jgi:type IV secretory pathway VirB4 component
MTPTAARPVDLENRSRPRLARLPLHRGTTAQVSSVYPWQVDDGLGAHGVFLGTTWPARSGWFYDPFTLYRDGVLDNPNVMIYGEPGSGKSACIKTLLARHVGLLGREGVGRQAWIIDPKEEYRPLAEALSMSVVRLRPGGDVRLNPLARVDGSDETPEQTLSRRTRLMTALLSSLHEHPLNREEDAIVGWAMEELTLADRTDDVTLPDVARLLESPSKQMAARAGCSMSELTRAARGVWMDVDKLVRRDLAGMFDGSTSIVSEWARSGTGLVLDVSAVFNDKPVLRLTMLAAISALQAILASADEADEWRVPQRFLVVDECWSILQNEEAARFLQEQWKLARRRGVANVAVCHRVTDLGAQADAGTAISKIGEGLIADAQTQVVFRTSAHALEATRAALGLTPTEAAELPRLPKACALWRVRGRSAFVQHLRSSYERTFTDTDGRLA